ncbi:MAG: hypothetical protein WA636_09710 [Methylovirgula sp.]
MHAKSVDIDPPCELQIFGDMIGQRGQSELGNLGATFAEFVKAAKPIGNDDIVAIRRDTAGNRRDARVGGQRYGFLEERKKDRVEGLFDRNEIGRDNSLLFAKQSFDEGGALRRPTLRSVIGRRSQSLRANAGDKGDADRHNGREEFDPVGENRHYGGFARLRPAGEHLLASRGQPGNSGFSACSLIKRRVGAFCAMTATPRRWMAGTSPAMT